MTRGLSLKTTTDGSEGCPLKEIAKMCAEDIQVVHDLINRRCLEIYIYLVKYSSDKDDT